MGFMSRHCGGYRSEGTDLGGKFGLAADDDLQLDVRICIYICEQLITVDPFGRVFE